MKFDYLTRLDSLPQKRPREGTLKTLETPSRVGFESFEGTSPRHISHERPSRGAPSDDPMTPCQACGCTQWHRLHDAGRWWCSTCWPWPADLPPLSMMTAPRSEP